MNAFTIDREKCNKDGICVAECPIRVLRMDDREGFPVPEPDFKDFCIKCGHCVAVCPTAAFSLDWLDPDDCKSVQEALAVTPEQAEQFLCGRRSIRTFKNKTVPREMLEKLLEVACFAPSAKNQQPWHWTVVLEPEEVRRLAELVISYLREITRNSPDVAERSGYPRVLASWEEGDERICRGAPHVIVAHADKNWGFGAEDCALALSLLDLYTTSIGLGACWAGYLYKAINAYPPLFEAVGLPADHQAFGAMMVGYPKYKYQRLPVRNRPLVTWK